MRCVCVLPVLELDEARVTSGEMQQNGDLNPEDQSLMTSFEIDLKDQRFVAAVIKPQRLSNVAMLPSSKTLDLHLGCVFMNSTDFSFL